MCFIWFISFVYLFILSLQFSFLAEGTKGGVLWQPSSGPGVLRLGSPGLTYADIISMWNVA